MTINEQEVINDFLDFWPSRMIHAKYNISTKTLMAILKNNNIKKNRDKNLVAKKKKILEGKIDISKLIECKLCGVLFNELPNHLKINHDNISPDDYSKQFGSPLVSLQSIEKRRKSAVEKFEKFPELRKMCSENGTKNITKVNNAGLGWRMPVGYHTEEHKKYMSELYTGREIKWKDKIKETHWSKNEEMRKKVTEQNSKHLAELVASGKFRSSVFSRFKKGYYFSIKSGIQEFYESSYELKRMIELDEDENVISWTKKHKIRIPYLFDNKNKNYVPDFLIEYENFKILEEIKGWVKNRKELQTKCQAGKVYCDNNNLIWKINFSFIPNEKQRTKCQNEFV